MSCSKPYESDVDILPGDASSLRIYICKYLYTHAWTYANISIYSNMRAYIYTCRAVLCHGRGVVGDQKRGQKRTPEPKEEHLSKTKFPFGPATDAPRVRGSYPAAFGVRGPTSRPVVPAVRPSAGHRRHALPGLHGRGSRHNVPQRSPRLRLPGSSQGGLEPTTRGAQPPP